MACGSNILYVYTFATWTGRMLVSDREWLQAFWQLATEIEMVSKSAQPRLLPAPNWMTSVSAVWDIGRCLATRYARRKCTVQVDRTSPQGHLLVRKCKSAYHLHIGARCLRLRKVVHCTVKTTAALTDVVRETRLNHVIFGRRKNRKLLLHKSSFSDTPSKT